MSKPKLPHCDHLTAIRRLVSLYLEKAEHDPMFAELIPLDRVLTFDIVELVASRGLFSAYDAKPHHKALAKSGWDDFRAKELVRQWLRERPKGGQQQ